MDVINAPNSAELAVDAGDNLTGRVAGDADTHVTVSYDGSPWATIPVAPDAGGAAFVCQLPPVAEATRAQVEVRGTQSGALVAGGSVARAPRPNGFGLRASDVFYPGHAPLCAVPWFRCDGVTMTVGGGHLPPGGDPSALSVRFGDGVSYKVSYPLPTPGWRDYYWYWPNAVHSGLEIAIDLLSSSLEADPFHFEFAETRDGRSRTLSEVWLPNDLRSFMAVTGDAQEIFRVQRGQAPSEMALPGYTTFRYLESKFAQYGIDVAGPVRLLDWGCGVGRVTSHFIRNWPHADVRGADIDAANVRSSQARLGEGRFAVVPLWPPAPYERGFFDGAFGVSVMTHLTAAAQAAWLAELSRILRPGGIALLTFCGAAGTSCGSAWRGPEWWESFSQRQFDDEIRDPVLDGFIADPGYYRATCQLPGDVQTRWSRHFDVLEIIEAAFGNQDLAVLRRR